MFLPGKLTRTGQTWWWFEFRPLLTTVGRYSDVNVFSPRGIDLSKDRYQNQVTTLVPGREDFRPLECPSESVDDGRGIREDVITPVSERPPRSVALD